MIVACLGVRGVNIVMRFFILAPRNTHARQMSRSVAHVGNHEISTRASILTGVGAARAPLLSLFGRRVYVKIGESLSVVDGEYM